MKNIALAAVLAASFATATLAEEVYVSGEMGVTQSDLGSEHSDFAYGLSAGFDAGSLRAEVSYVNLDTESLFGDVDADALFATVFVEHTFESGVTPYVGVGPGWVWVENAGLSDDGLAWNFVGGVSAPVAEGVSVFGQYRYVVSHEAETWFGDYDTNLFTAGLRVAL